MVAPRRLTRPCLAQALPSSPAFGPGGRAAATHRRSEGGGRRGGLNVVVARPVHREPGYMPATVTPWPGGWGVLQTQHDAQLSPTLLSDELPPQPERKTS